MKASFVRVLLQKTVFKTWISKLKQFGGSESYWIERYLKGGNSGSGSYGKLAEFKAEVINTLVREKIYKLS